MDSEKTCEICRKEFTTPYVKRRHLRNIHKLTDESLVLSSKTAHHIKCVLCSEKEIFADYNAYEEHLMKIHSISLNKSIFNFNNFEEFEAWKSLENRDVDYASGGGYSIKGNQYKYYICNRSNVRGFTSNSKIRKLKGEGSIKISGICPSKINVKILKDGSVTAKYVETHVGHEDELRSKRLSKAEQNSIVSKLTAGVSKDRIIQESRKVESNKLQRINTIRQGDLAYLIRRFNIDKKRNDEDMKATALKVEKWKLKGKNHAFLLKLLGESYPGLKDEDFALGYMNGVMEKKIKDYNQIICIDGIHGRNRNNWDLTTVLVEDEQNRLFPVAFLISNRNDQTIQTIFFRTLKERLGTNIEAGYLMTDDDIKYYNAWTEVMTSEKKPMRLLCTWHVINNWNIQGRSKIKKVENRLKMKKEMRLILNEKNIIKFMQLKQNYFKELEEQGEQEFLNYLQNNYFQNNQRIMMWAYCYRVTLGINTNMSIEGLNKLLKYGKMNGQQNIRIEKLLDLFEEFENEMIWERITNFERPNSNSQKMTLEEEEVSPEDFSNNEPSTSQSDNENESIQEKCDDEHSKTPINLEKRREVFNEEMINFTNSLDEKSFELWEETFIKFKNDNEICKKRKIEKQSGHPNKKKFEPICPPPSREHLRALLPPQPLPLRATIQPSLQAARSKPSKPRAILPWPSPQNFTASSAKIS